MKQTDWDRYLEYDPSDTIWNDGSSRVERPLVERTRGMAYKDHKEDELEQRKTRKRMKLKRKRQIESSKRFGGLFAKKRKMMAGWIIHQVKNWLTPHFHCLSL